MRLFLSLVLGLVVLLGLGQVLVHQPSVAQQPKKIQWEYCELYRNWNPANKEISLRLLLPTDTIQAKSVKEMNERLGHNSDSEKTLSVVNALGAQGWELVTTVEYESTRDVRWLIQSWTFKRQK